MGAPDQVDTDQSANTKVKSHWVYPDGEIGFDEEGIVVDVSISGQ